MSFGGSQMTSGAENLGIYNGHPHAKPDSEEVSRPVDVRISVHGIDAAEFDDKFADATVDVRVWYLWTDPRLADWPSGSELPPDLWVPEFMMQGLLPDKVQAALDSGPRMGGSLGFTKGGEKTGALGLMLVLQKVVVSCKASADIRHFPLDTHKVHVFFSAGKSINGASIKIRYEPYGAGMLAPSYMPGDGDKTVDKIVQADEWHTTRLEWGFCQHSSPASGLDYHDAVVILHRRRVPSYYLMKALYPTAVCGFLAMASLIVPAEDLAARFGILLTLFLTVFAIQWITNDRMPKTPFLTKLDAQIAMTLIHIILMCVVSMVLKAALRLGADADIIEQVELGAFIFFAAAWLIGFGSQAWAIHKHETSREAQSKETETYWNWWEGCRWEADVEPDGTVGAARSVAGGIADFSRAETDNPVADAVDSTT